ncbi:hypothetical protein ACOSP7_024930 [Xanthoceras sorbifolium]
MVLWSAPPYYLYKINTDASLDLHSGWSGVSIVIRNHAGLVLASSVQRLGVGFSVLVVEIMAILKGLQFAVESGLVPVVLKSDSSLAVSAINGDTVFLSEVGLIIHDVVELLRSIPSSAVRFVPRSANMAAHYLARFALRLDSDCF